MFKFNNAISVLFVGSFVLHLPTFYLVGFRWDDHSRSQYWWDGSQLIHTHHKSYICYNFKTFSRTYSHKKYKYANLEPEHKHSTCAEFFEKRDVQCFQKWNSYVPNVQIHKCQNVHTYLIMIKTHHCHHQQYHTFFKPMYQIVPEWTRLH